MSNWKTLSQDLTELLQLKSRIISVKRMDEEKYEPDYLLIYATGAQQTLLMNGLQYFEYEKVDSSFTGEGFCTDALPRCAETGSPSLCLPCLGYPIGHLEAGMDVTPLFETWYPVLD